MKGKIYHIGGDEKFINSAIEQFENSFKGCNSFYILSKNREIPMQHVNESAVVYKVVADDLIELALRLTKDDLVVLHCLSPKFYDFVLHVPLSVKIVWLCFGFEVYNDSKYFKSQILLDEITNIRFPEPSISVKKKIKDEMRPFYRFINIKLPLTSKEKKAKAMKRIDYLGSSFQEEFTQVCKLIKLKKFFFSFWYYPLEIIVDTEKRIVFPKNKIIIGNSGFKTGNHLDVFYKIRTYELDKLPIILPLSYGDEEYINFVLKQGKEIFGTNFMPLLDFMPLQEYNTILEDVGVAILNNKRQQAVGNTIALLWFGTKVFLSDKNPFYHYLKRIGVEVYCYETELNAKSVIEFLSLEVIEKNRKLLYSELNRSHLANLLKNQILEINE